MKDMNSMIVITLRTVLFTADEKLTIDQKLSKPKTIQNKSTHI